MTTSGSGVRTINARRNIIYGFMQVVVSQVLPFITRTILIYRFGADYLGVGSLFVSVLGVLSLMELGFGTAVVYSMYGPAAGGDTNLLRAYLKYRKNIENSLKDDPFKSRYIFRSQNVTGFFVIYTKIAVKYF